MNNNCFIILLILAIQLYLNPSILAKDSTEGLRKTVERLQRTVEGLQEEVSFLETEDSSLLTKIEDRLKVNLYGTLEFENFENKDSSFDAKNMELILEGNITDRLKAFSEIEFERTAKTSKSSRQGDVELEQGWLEYSINNYFKPRFGVILVPFGRFNLDHFDIFRDLVDRPIAMRRVIPTTWSEAGAGFTGNAFIGDKFSGSWLEELALDYQFFVINGLTDELKDTSTRDARGAFGKDNNNNKALAARLGITLMDGKEIGVSGYTGKYDDGSDAEINGVDVDWKFVFGPLEIIGEYAFFDLEKGLNKDGIEVPSDLKGGYVQANYHFWFDVLNNTLLGRDFESPTFTLVTRVERSEIDDDGDPGIGDNREERLTMGLNYRPVETWVFKFDYQFNSANNESLERGDNDGFIFSVSASF